MPEVSGLSIVIDEDDNSVRVDPVSGTVETDQPDGAVVVQLDHHRPKPEGGENEWFANLADEIDGQRLASIANDLIDAIEADDRSRQGYLAVRTRGMDLLGLELKEPKASVGESSSAAEGLSTVTNPLLLETCLRAWANAQAELLPASGPVKVKDDGQETKSEDDLADSFERDLNHWFTTTASEYYPDTSHMLLWGSVFAGSGFKKIYRCPLKRRPTSQSVDAKDLIVSDTTKDLKSCERVTHQIMMRPSVLKRMQLAGAYRKIEATQPSPSVNVVDEKIGAIQGTTASKTRPEDQPYTIWETQCELDLSEFATGKFKGEAIPLPYLVTIDKDSRAVLAIRRDWNEDDTECERKRMWVKYPYIPGPGFYGTGMLNVLGNASAAMTAAWRLSLDAAMLSNFPAGFIDKGMTRQNTSDIRIGPGQFYGLDLGGRDIRAVVAPTPFKDVSSGMMALIDKITSQAEKAGGAADIPAAEGIANVPVGTMLAQIEQATKVIAATHKGLHTAMSEDIAITVDLFRDNPEDFWRTNKVCPKNYWNEQKFLQALDNCDLVPVSDPNVPSHIHRIAKALALVEMWKIFGPTGRLFEEEVIQRCLRAIREDPQGLVNPNPPPQQPQQGGKAPPDPNIGLAKRMDAETNALKAQTAVQTEAQKAQTERDQMQGEKELRDKDIQKELIIHGSERQAAESQTQLEQDKLGLEAAKTAHAQQMEQRSHTLEGIKALNEHELAQRQHAHDVESQAREHGLATQEHVAGLAQDARDHSLESAKAAHDALMARREHALNEYEVKHPPPASAGAGSPKKPKKT